MSASDWTVCPRCKTRKQAAAQATLDAVKAQYGQLDADEYTETVGAAQADVVAAVEFHDQTFREDYEIYGAELGVVTVSYGGSCDVCGLRLGFRHDHEIPGVNE